MNTPLGRVSKERLGENIFERDHFKGMSSVTNFIGTVYNVTQLIRNAPAIVSSFKGILQGIWSPAGAKAGEELSQAGQAVIAAGTALDEPISQVSISSSGLAAMTNTTSGAIANIGQAVASLSMASVGAISAGLTLVVAAVQSIAAVMPLAIRTGLLSLMVMMFSSFGGGGVGGSGGGGSNPPPAPKPSVPQLVKDVTLPEGYKAGSKGYRDLIIDKLIDQDTLANIRKHLPTMDGKSNLPVAGVDDKYSVAGTTVSLENGSIATAIDTNGRNAVLPSTVEQVYPGFESWHAEPNGIGQLVQKQGSLAIDTTKPMIIVTDRVPCSQCLDFTRGQNDVRGQILKGAEQLGLSKVEVDYLGRVPVNTPDAGKVTGIGNFTLELDSTSGLWRLTKSLFKVND